MELIGWRRPPRIVGHNLWGVFLQSEASVMSMINVTLPDGTINEYAEGITCAEGLLMH